MMLQHAATVNDPEDLVHHATLGFLVEQQGGILGDQLQLMKKGGRKACGTSNP